MNKITRVTTRDARFDLPGGSGSDSVHGDPQYAYAVTQLHAGNLIGEGASFTLGDGNDVVCELAQILGERLLVIGGTDIEEIMAQFGALHKQLADHSRLRWLGPHKGAVHLALASVTNAAFDLWALHRDQPLWELLLSLDDESVVALLDLSWIDDRLSHVDAVELVGSHRSTRSERLPITESGYPGYDTSIGWFNYSDAEVSARTERAVSRGFGALKLKVGSADLARDLRRFSLVREAAGAETRIMVDANQQWSLREAEIACREFARLGAHWIEEPTHPDDVLGHQRLATIARSGGSLIALGEHVSNRVQFKNFMEADAVDVVQVDALRVAGVSEFIAVSMLATSFGLPVVPHVGDMGQLHQHLVLFNHVALGLPAELLEYIPHLSDRFVDPAIVADGVYQTPRMAGAGQRLVAE